MGGGRKAWELHQRLRRIRVTWWDDSVRLAPLVAAAAAVADLLLLGLLHVVSPGVDPMTRPVSEYAPGRVRVVGDDQDGGSRGGRYCACGGPAPRAGGDPGPGVGGSHDSAGCRSPEARHTALSGRCAGDARDHRRSDTQRAWESDVPLASLGGPPAIPNVDADGKPIGSRMLSGAGGTDSRSVDWERRRGVRLGPTCLPGLERDLAVSRRSSGA